MLEWEAVTQAEALRETEAMGITEPALRAPFQHYHAVDPWFQPDLRNGCTASGCHDPVPHSRSKSLRAFANLHSTFLTCTVCHYVPTATPMPAAWVDLTTGRRQMPPAILQLMGVFSGTATQPATVLADRTHEIRQLLRRTMEVVGWDPVLNYLDVQLETSDAGSPVWRRAVDELRAELPNHARGDYGAKIAPLDREGKPVVRHFPDLVKQYFSRESDQGRQGAFDKIHEGVLRKPKGCLSCHLQQPPLLDLKALGYPDARVEILTGRRPSPQLSVAELMQSISEGRPFNLPLGP